MISTVPLSVQQYLRPHSHDNSFAERGNWQLLIRIASLHDYDKGAILKRLHPRP